MKNLLLIIALCFSFNVFSQYDENAPWMKNIPRNANKEAKFVDIVNAFNDYWKDKDFRKKGSGYKPFKRWENRWENLVKPDGYVISPKEINDAFVQKKQSLMSRSAMALPVSNWTPIGPFTHTNTGSWSSGQGRVNFTYVDPSNANTIYIGSPAGGIWKSTNNGSTWTPMSDQLAQIGVSGIAVDPTNSNIIYITTGDKDGADTYSIGVLKSIDGGTTWNTTGLTFSNTSSFAGDIVIHPTNNQILLCATNVGLYRSTNTGTSWTVVQTGSFSKGSIKFKPNDAATIYATTNNRFYRSTNDGANFTYIASGSPAGSGRLLIDVTPADGNYLYMLASSTANTFQGIYQSTDSGTTWTKTDSGTDVFDGSTQASYDLAFAVSPTNRDEMYTGCLNVWKLSAGGATAVKLNNWNAPASATYTHADIHHLQFYGNKLYVGSDGGIYRSENAGISFSDLTAGAQISQFYKIAVSKQSSGKMVGGLQDNGGHAYSNNLWKNYYGADGMDTGVDPTDSNKFYGFIQFGGSLNISANAGNSRASSVAAPAAEKGTNDDGGNWITPLTVNSVGEVFAGYRSLYKLNAGAWELQSAAQIGTGDVELITVDPSNDDIIYVANGVGLFKSTDRGLNFTNVYNASFPITSICVNYSNSNIVYLTTSGTGGLALKSTNGGTVFTSFSQNLPNISKRVIKHQGRNTLNPLYIGTTLGVYYRDDSMSQWEPFDINLPNVEVTDLEINIEDNIITAATYGRGIWQSPIPVEVPANDIKLVSIQNPNAELSCNGNISPQFTVKNNGLNPISSVNVTYNYNGSPQNFVWNGSIASQASQNIPISMFNVATKGVYSLNIESTITGDAYSDNNKAKTTFYINDSGTVNVTNPFTTATNELLTNTDGLTTSQWQRAIKVGGAMASGSGNTVYTTNTIGNYPDSVKAYLYSQCYNLTNVTSPVIKFKMKYSLENNYDIVYVEYSTNSGQTWAVLGEQGPNWYNSNRTNASSGAANDCENCPGAQWTGVNTTTTSYFYPLTALVGQSNVVFRIVFHSDEGVNQLGVNIDDLVIEGLLSNQEFSLNNISIYPNPSTGLFTISNADKIIEKLEIYDISGKIILTKNNFSIQNETSFDISNASTGIYFVKITSDNQTSIKKIIKN